MQIALLRNSADIPDADAGSDVMQWFESAARALLIAVIVLTGAAIVRNVTDTLTAAAHGPVLERTASLTLVSR